MRDGVFLAEILKTVPVTHPRMGAKVAALQHCTSTQYDSSEELSNHTHWSGARLHLSAFPEENSP